MRRTRWLTALFLLLAATVLAGPGLAGTASAAYPGADGKIAFTRGGQIYSISPSGSGLRQLTSGTPNFRPRWSPDGKRIAYVHQTSTKATDIWVMSADGSAKTKVTRLGKVTGASWSPDGTWLAFGSPLQRIRSVAPFGIPQKWLGKGPDWLESANDGYYELGVDGPPAWSPDGARISYYTHDYAPADNYLAVYNIATRDVEVLEATGNSCCGEGYFGDPAWSASGARLAYTATPFAYVTQPPRVKVIQYPAATTSAFASVNRDQQPAFSPSGRYVALVSASTSPPRIYVTNFDGSGRRLLTTGYHPDWQPLR